MWGQEAHAAPVASRAVDWSGGEAAGGKAAYTAYCQTCHGASGGGDGPGAVALDPKPRDFTTGQFAFDPDGDGRKGEAQDLASVIQNGAAVYGGSANMAAWGAVLSERDVRNLVAYVQSFSDGS